MAPTVTCFTSTHETIVVGGTHTPELLDQANAPWVSELMSADRLYARSIDLFAEEGLLASDSIAVIAADSDEQAITDTVLPAMNEVGAEPQAVLYTTATGDQIALATESQVYAERLLADGIDTVVVVGGLATVWGLLDQNGWSGNRLMIDPTESVIQLASLPGHDPAIFDGLIATIGQIGNETAENPPAQDCISAFQDAHPDIEILPVDEVPEGEPDWATGIVGICSQLDLFKQIAIASGADLTNDSFATAAASLTESFPTAFSPFNSLGPGKFDAADGLRLAVFDSTLELGPGLRPLTPIADLGQ